MLVFGAPAYADASLSLFLSLSHILCVQRDQWLKCKRLVIDEISMVDGDWFDEVGLAKIDQTC